MAIEYKLLENGNGIAMDDNGHPIVVERDESNEDAEPKEFGLDAVHLYSKIPALQAEAKSYREERDAFKEKVEALGDLDPKEVREKLKSFGDLDPQKAREALETVQNLGQLDKEKSIEIDKVKAGVAEAYESKMKDLEDSYNRRVQALEGDVNNKDSAIRELLIKGAFDRSSFIKDKTVLPSEVAYNTFGRHFSIENDDRLGLRAIATDYSGDKIFSTAKPGDPASPEEAIEYLIEHYPQKDTFLKSSGGSGSGAGGNLSGDGNERAKLAAIKGLPPAERLNALRNAG